MTSTLTPSDVLAAIFDGVMDDDFDALIDAYKSRVRTVRENKGRLNALTIKPGDRVQITNISPKYLDGLEGVVLTASVGSGRGKPRFDVKVDRMPRQGTSRFYNNTVHGVPASALRKVA